MQAANARQTAQDEAAGAPSWFKTAMSRVMPGGPAGYALAQSLTPRGVQAAGRGAVQGLVGGPGALEDFATHTIPGALGVKGERGRLPDGSDTFFPKPSDVGAALTRAGVPEYPDQPLATAAGEFLGGAFTPGPPAGRAGKAGSEAAMGALRRAAAGGKAGETIRGLAGNVGDTAAARAAQRVAETPAPTPMAPASSGLKFKPQAPAMPVPPLEVSGKLEQAIAANDARLGEAKTAAYNKFAETLPTAPAPDIEPLKETLRAKMRDAGTADARNAYEKLLNDLSHVEQESQTKFQAYDQIRRQLAQKAKFGEEVSGYGAIAANEAKDAARQLGDAMKEAHPPYAEYTKKYSDLSRESQPAGAKFLASVGEKEGGDLMAAALRSPKNVDTAIAAMGGDTAVFDKLASQYVMNKLPASLVSMEKFINEMSPTIAKLPATQKALTTAVQKAHLQVALEGAAQRAEKALAERAQGVATNAAAQQALHDQAQATANSYAPKLIRLQKATDPKEQATLLNSVVDSMQKDGLITLDEYRAYVDQINSANTALKRQAALQRLSKFIVYALTGNYLISFGGPAFVEAASAASKAAR